MIVRSGPPGDSGARAREMLESGQAVASEVHGESVSVVQRGASGYETVSLSEGDGSERPGFLARALLPAGYPENVHPDYLPFRKWQFVRDVAAGITSFYATEAVVGAMGYGDIGPLSAGMTWMIRDAVDGAGKFGASLVAYKADQDPRSWTIKGETFAAAGTLMETALLAVPQSFPIMAPLANIAKAMGNGTKTACSATIEKHQALANNLGDLHSKNSNQSMVASAVGAGLAVGLKLGLQQVIGPAAVPLIAAACTGVALYAQKKSVDALQIYDLSEASVRKIARCWARDGKLPAPDHNDGLKELTRGMLRNDCDLELGCSLSKISGDARHFDDLRSWYWDKKYLLDWDGDDKIRVLLHPDAQPRDLVAATLQAQLLAELRHAEGFKSVRKTEGKEAARDWAITTSLRATPDAQKLIEKLDRLGWTADRILIRPGSPRAEWQPTITSERGSDLSIEQFRELAGLKG